MKTFDEGTFAASPETRARREREREREKERARQKRREKETKRKKECTTNGDNVRNAFIAREEDEENLFLLLRI